MTVLQRSVWLVGMIALAFCVVMISAWCALALWYRLPFQTWARVFCAFTVVDVGLVTIVGLFRGLWLKATALFVVVVLLVFGWWSTLRPPAEADWAPDVARQVTGTVTGDRLTLTGVRNFDWRTNDDFTERWGTEDYDLTKLRTLDLFMSYWSGPYIAHMMLSFGFDDGRHLVWSVEVRHKRGSEYSPIADFFKTDTLVSIAAHERDVIGVRSNIRGEDVQLYRMIVPTETARALLLAYVDDANSLAKTPVWYNSITTNCTTAVVAMVRALGDTIPFDWRLYINGYVPDYIYAHGALDTKVPMSELRRLSHIDERAKQIGLTDAFSDAIRRGMAPNGPVETR